VLIVSPVKGGLADEFRLLLEKHGQRVAVALWNDASTRLARDFDLVIVTGPGRAVKRSEAVLDFGRPVLGVGPYGCKYFGLLNLKHGHPYT
jgi:hypothetical protein